MHITAIKTHKIVKSDTSIFAVLDKYVSSFAEKSVLAVTSKIVAICEGSIVPITDVQKEELVRKEADYFLPPSGWYNISFAIKNNILAASAGIDESNGNEYYILWPKDPQKTANDIREYLVRRFGVKYAGVVITDSKTYPLRWGTSGFALSHSGFLALHDYVGSPDIFGRKLQYTKANIMDALACSAVVVMGEGDEQQPLAVVQDIPFVQFQDRNPRQDELDALQIDRKDDLYAPFLTSVQWKKGGDCK